MKTKEGTYTMAEAEEALANGETVYLHTFTGTHRVSWIDGVRVHTPDTNNGFGSTWHVSGRCFEIDRSDTASTRPECVKDLRYYYCAEGGDVEHSSSVAHHTGTFHVLEVMGPPMCIHGWPDTHAVKVLCSVHPRNKEYLVGCDEDGTLTEV